MESQKPPEFGKRGRAPPIVTHAPEGLGGVPARPRAHWLGWTLAGIGTLYAIIFAALAFRQDCKHDDQSWDDGNTQTQQSCRHSSGFHFGGGGWGGVHSTSFGGFGGSGEGGGHGGEGGHGGGGE